MAELSVANKLILAFVTLIVGAVLIGSIATGGQAVTTYKSSASEVHNVLPTYATGRNNTAINPSITYTLTNAPTGWKTTDCPISSFVLENSSGADFALTTDYVLTASAGTYTLVDSATALATLPTANNNTYASYSYCGDDYMNLSWGRTGINLVSGFFALAMLLTSVGLFYSVAKDTGMI